MICTDMCPILYRSGEFRKHLTVPLNSPHIRDTAVLFVIGRVEIAAATLRDLNDGMVVLLRNLSDEIVDSAGPYLHAGICQRTLGGALAARIPV